MASKPEQQLEIAELPIQPRIQFGLSLVRRLLRRAEQLTGLPKGDLALRNHARTHCWARFAVMKVAHEHGRGASLIGKCIGLDHSSVIHGLKRAGQLEHCDSDFSDLLTLLRREVAQ